MVARAFGRLNATPSGSRSRYRSAPASEPTSPTSKEAGSAGGAGGAGRMGSMVGAGVAAGPAAAEAGAPGGGEGWAARGDEVGRSAMGNSASVLARARVRRGERSRIRTVCGRAGAQGPGTSADGRAKVVERA